MTASAGSNLHSYHHIRLLLLCCPADLAECHGDQGWQAEPVEVVAFLHQSSSLDLLRDGGWARVPKIGRKARKGSN